MTLTRPDLRTLAFLALGGGIYGFALSIRPLLRRLKGIPAKGSGLDTSILGPPGFELELTEPVTALGVYGRRRRAATVRFQVDEPDELESRLRARLSEIKA